MSMSRSPAVGVHPLYVFIHIYIYLNKSNILSVVKQNVTLIPERQFGNGNARGESSPQGLTPDRKCRQLQTGKEIAVASPLTF